MSAIDFVLKHSYNICINNHCDYDYPQIYI